MDEMEKTSTEVTNLNTKLDQLLKKQKESKRWDILLAICTALIGFAVWKAQSGIQAHIDEASREVTTRLAITQQFYSRKLATYEDVHRQMATLVRSLKDARFNTGAKKTAVDSLNELYVSYTTNSLYLSNDLVSHIRLLVSLGNQLPSLYPPGKTTMQEIDVQVTAIEDQMKKDLHVEELGKIPGLDRSR